MTAKSRKSHIPTPANSVAALCILRAFARTNTPASLWRALPSYEEASADNLESNTTPAEDSELSRHSRRIAEARSCWEIIKEGFLQPDISLAKDVYDTRGGHAWHAEPIDDVYSDDDMPRLRPVTPLAWPLLDWLLTVLENDEAVSFDCNHGASS